MLDSTSSAAVQGRYRCDLLERFSADYKFDLPSAVILVHHARCHSGWGSSPQLAAQCYAPTHRLPSDPSVPPRHIGSSGQTYSGDQTTSLVVQGRHARPQATLSLETDSRLSFLLMGQELQCSQCGNCIAPTVVLHVQPNA